MVTNTVQDAWFKLTHSVQTWRRRSYTVAPIDCALLTGLPHLVVLVRETCVQTRSTPFSWLSELVFMNVRSMTPFSCLTQSFPKRLSYLPIDIPSRGRILLCVTSGSLSSDVGVENPNSPSMVLVCVTLWQRVCSTVFAIKETRLSSWSKI